MKILIVEDDVELSNLMEKVLCKYLVFGILTYACTWNYSSVTK